MINAAFKGSGGMIEPENANQIRINLLSDILANVLHRNFMTIILSVS